MTNAIKQARSIEQVVEIINASKAGHSVAYFGGSDLRSAEEMSAEYAIDAAIESGYADSVEAHLDYLINAGANFDFHEALELATKSKIA